MTYPVESPAPRAGGTGQQTTSIKQKTVSSVGPEPQGRLKATFNEAIELLGCKAELADQFAEWRRRARADGLDPTAILRLAREHRRNAEQRRKAAEQADVEDLYRQGLGLPLFDHGRMA